MEKASGEPLAYADTATPGGLDQRRGVGDLPQEREGAALPVDCILPSWKRDVPSSSPPAAGE